MPDTYLSLPYEHPEPLPDGYVDEVRTPAALVEYALDRYSEPGDVVLDPFAGFGTTLRVAERMDRQPHGVEYEPDRVEYVRGVVDDPDRVRRGSALELGELDLPTVDLAFTSPPFMVRGMERNPFENYDGETTYGAYLDDARTAFRGIADRLAPGSRAVLDVSNVRHEGEVTPLAWDLAGVGGDVLHFDGEVVVAWEGDGDPAREGNFGYGYDHTYLLVFSKGAA